MVRFPVFDGHNDTLTRPYSFLEANDVGHLDLPRAHAGGLIGGIFAIYTPPPESSPERDLFYGATFTEEGYDFPLNSPLEYEYAGEFTRSIMASLYGMQMEAGGELSIVTSYEALERNLAEGVFSVVLHFEGAEAIEEDLSNLEAYYSAGLRSLGLTWSRPNVFGCGVPFRFPDSPDTGPGLTEAGQSLVRECNRQGIMLDLAHLNEQGFWEVARLSQAPLVVSHAAVHALCPFTRNLTDAQIDAIGETNGLMGIIFEPGSLRSDGQAELDTPLEEIVRHIDYVVQRIGIDHVAFGSDFDGADIPLELGDVTGLPRLTELLQEYVYDDEAVLKIAYQNWFRVLRESWNE